MIGPRVIFACTIGWFLSLLCFLPGGRASAFHRFFFFSQGTIFSTNHLSEAGGFVPALVLNRRKRRSRRGRVNKVSSEKPTEQSDPNSNVRFQSSPERNRQAIEALRRLILDGSVKPAPGITVVAPVVDISKHRKKP
jgi:hypothetical protein